MSHNDYKEGWGIIDADGLSIRTVSDTRRAALVNWLYINTVPGKWIHNDMPDDEIEELWVAYCGDAMVRPVRCYVQP